MGSLRFETYHAGSFLVEHLRLAGVMQRMEHDGGDIILFRSRDDKRISIHLIDSALPLYEIRKTLEANACNDIYTMFVLWAHMMLPEHGQHYLPEDWMQALCSLHDGLIYGYDYFNAEVYVFPVFFKGSGGMRRIEYGTTIHGRSLRTSVVETRVPGFVGNWWVASFHSASAGTLPIEADLAECYALLGVDQGDDMETIKKAYRLLARRFHPDSNQEADATATMQRLNEAYARIQSAHEGDQ